ncbi:hypothetical protein BOW53_14315 [Solemya pervernicosa gill symbiont]|uniref:Motility protein n=2 Tax=Gammaproteobacteria incertae sedis TaxID=118884 RepID=A0A1T2L0Y3_9GAMM|nr:hypothetical protein [Candidatus Reidiella endopervernicosa]OOZ38767.1 hypothetical protein BOW53_14315 [Solemya pervernicosa gill symbiont]QKQ26363.1 hypothetical protein HUE57_08780 [Candidatus Reidiella endopervernicosa]
MNSISIPGNDIAAAQAKKLAIQSQGITALSLIASLPKPQAAASAQNSAAPDPTSRIGHNINVRA